MGISLVAHWSTVVVLAAATAWTVFVGTLAVARHDSLQTNAFDLGYVSQALWYDAHGSPFRYTTLQGVDAVLEGVDTAKVRHPTWLLAFHVEPALLLFAPLYRLWPDPRMLLWLQAGLIAAGALPAAWLACRLIGGQLAALVFGLAYLLAPGLEGAALSDFHMVAIGATLLMAGLWRLEEGDTRQAIVWLGLAALCREDAALEAAWLSILFILLNWTVDRRVKLLAIGAAGWTVLSFAVIEPLFNGGASAFAGRYGWLKIGALALVQRQDLSPLQAWLSGSAPYVALELLTSGVVALLAPWHLLAALPLLAINAGSSFDWMRSGGGHYSALLVPVLLWASMHGLRRLSAGLRTSGSNASSLTGSAARSVWTAWLLALVLASAVAAQAWVGVSPLRRGLGSSEPRAAAVLDLIGAIPSDAAVSATSALYPHLSARRDAYWFPARPASEWRALDVAGSTHPLSTAAMRTAVLRQLSRADTDIVGARDGALVLERIPGRQRESLLSTDATQATLGHALRSDPAALPPDFYSFVFAGSTLPATAVPFGPARFGPVLELIGYELRRWPEVGLAGDSASLTTYWRAMAPVDEDLRFAAATTRSSDGALSGFRVDSAAGSLWYPTSRWPVRDPMRLEMPLGQIGSLQAAGVAVFDPEGRRLPVAPAPGFSTWDGQTIAAVADLR